MSAISNTDLQKYIKAGVNGNFDISSVIGQFGGQVSGTSYNDIAWFVNALQSGDTGNIIQSGIQTIGGIFSNLSTNDAAEASKRNDKDNKKINDNKEKTNEIFASLNESLNTILSTCDEKKELIESALETIEKLGGDKGQIAEKQQQLQEKLAQIKAQQEILNNPNTKSDERRQAIQTILGLVSDINTIAAEVDNYKSQLEAQQETVQTASKDIEDLTEEMESIKDKGQTDAAELTQENIQLLAESTKKVADGTGKEVLGTQQVTAGEAMTSGPQAIVSGSEGVQLILSGKSKITGGAQLMSGAANDFKNIAANTSNIQEAFTSFSSFVQGIGEYNDGIKELVGAFNATVEPMITSVGSWETVKTTNQALGEYTTEYAQNIGMNEVQKDGSIDESKADKNKELSYQKYEFDMSAFDNIFAKKQA